MLEKVLDLIRAKRREEARRTTDVGDSESTACLTFLDILLIKPKADSTSQRIEI
jgi:hypothetical protein